MKNAIHDSRWILTDFSGDRGDPLLEFCFQSAVGERFCVLDVEQLQLKRIHKLFCLSDKFIQVYGPSEYINECTICLWE